MGYFESLCQLCAVSFAIARIRTSAEPPEAGWDYTGEGFCEIDNPDEEPCKPHSETGCSSVTRGDQDEHLAGPGCRSGRGYNGAIITLAEMKGCRALRGMVRKSADSMDDFQPEDDDEPWERETRYFFTGTGDGSPDEAPLDEFDKVRHGADCVLINNIFYGDEDDNAIPVHPTCWEIFKRVSMQTLGSVDVHGFWKFQVLNDDFDDFFVKYPRHPAVRSGNEQWWDHELGSEWLAANPVDIPGFAGLFKTYNIQPTEQAISMGSFDVNQDAFAKPSYGVTSKSDEQDSMPISTDDDPFASLPPELRLMVQELLPSSSIAALRLASRSMQPLPIIAFRRLVFEDMPWLWEARDLPPAMTNWFQLYKKAKFVWPGIKGLKNRARIWKEVTEMCRRIRVHREKRQIRGTTGWEEDADLNDSDHDSDSSDE